MWTSAAQFETAEHQFYGALAHAGHRAQGVGVGLDLGGHGGWRVTQAARPVLKGEQRVALREVLKGGQAERDYEYLVVAVDPVNFEKPYAEGIEGVSVVHKATPPENSRMNRRSFLRAIGLLPLEATHLCLASGFHGGGHVLQPARNAQGAIASGAGGSF